jgi:hypothetical protein
MKNYQISASIVIEKRKINKAGLVPVKLRITYLRQNVFDSIRDKKGSPIWINETQFNKLQNKKIANDLKQYKNYFNEIEAKANSVISENFNDINSFSFDKFKDLFFEKNENKTNDLFKLLKNKAEEIKNENRIATAIGYKYTLNSLKSFVVPPPKPIIKE